MSRDKRSKLDDPTAERTADTSTQSASGLTAGRGGPGVEQNEDTDTMRRTSEERDADTTPRRYEQPTDENPVLPGDDASLGTKI